MEALFSCRDPLCYKSAVDLVKKCYLSVVSDKVLLRSIFEEKELQPLSEGMQENILDVTVRYGISKSYPPPISYQKFFLRLFIDVVEFYGSEFSDGLLQAYTQILMKPSKEEISYHNYVLHDGAIITVQESPCFVLNSTTGLRTWEASKFLSEWCIENRKLLNNRTILELGSGIGLLGLVVLKTSHPKKFIFTDKSWEVLNVLSSNIDIHLKTIKDRNCLKRKQEYAALTTGGESLQNAHLTSEIEKHNLIWNKITVEDALHLFPDIILGADLVYDPAMIQSLVQALKIFLNNGTICAYIAIVVRNMGTTVKFEKELDCSDLKYEVLMGPMTSLFVYDKTSNFRLYKIFRGLSLEN